MDRHAGWLEHRVAEAADAWLTDPQDVAVYARLVAAVHERRAYLWPRLDQTPAGQEQLLEPPAGVRVGDLLGGEDPRAVLERLRHTAGRHVDDSVLAHISPAHSENVNFFGTISVDVDRELAQLDAAGYRPLRGTTTSTSDS